jgi:hypothetical protein
MTMKVTAYPANAKNPWTTYAGAVGELEKDARTGELRFKGLAYTQEGDARQVDVKVKNDRLRLRVGTSGHTELFRIYREDT